MTRGGVNGPDDINCTCDAPPGILALRELLFRIAVICNAEDMDRLLGDIFGLRAVSGLGDGYGLLPLLANAAWF